MSLAISAQPLPSYRPWPAFGPHVPAWDVVGNELMVPVATLFPVCSGGSHSPPSARRAVRSRPRPGPGGPVSRASPPSSSAPHLALPDPEGCSATPRGSAQTQRGLQSPHTPGARPPRLWTPPLAPLSPPLLLKEAEQEWWHGWNVGPWGRRPPQPP